MTEAKLFSGENATLKTEYSDDHHSESSRHVSKDDTAAVAAFDATNVVNSVQVHATMLPDVRCCAQCGTTQTPQWRNGPKGPRTLCNACGIRLHRRLNKIKMGSTPRRRKKTTKSSNTRGSNGGVNTRHTPTSSSYSNPYNHRSYLKSKTQGGAGAGDRMDHDLLNNAHDSDVVYLGRRSRRNTVDSTTNRNGVTRPRSQRLRSRRLREMTSTLNRSRSFRCEDFTAAIDLLSLSEERYRLIGKSLESLPNQYECLKSEVGVTDKDLLACSRALPQSSSPNFKKIQSELVNAQWEVQAAEVGTRTVAEILHEWSAEMAEKKSRYWEARSQLEALILQHFKSTTQT